MAELEECMASGDPQRTSFPEMIQKLRLEWHESMTFPDLIALCDSLDNLLHEIRSTRNIRSPIVKCPNAENWTRRGTTCERPRHGSFAEPVQYRRPGAR